MRKKFVLNCLSHWLSHWRLISVMHFLWVWVLYKLFRLASWVHNINIRDTLPVVHYGLWWVLHRLFRILQDEYTTWTLDLLYQLLIMDKGEYSTDYSESCKVSGLNTILKYSTSCSLWTRVSTLQIIQNLARWVHNIEILYQLLIMDKGEYSADYSESYRVSTQHQY